MSRDEALRSYLKTACEEPFVYGRNDCGHWVGRWVERCRGVNPFAAYLDRYTTKIGCARVVNRAGGLLALAHREFARAGMSGIEPSSAIMGDVGCLSTEAGPALMIKASGQRWAWKGGDTVQCGAEWPVLAAWRV